MRLRKSLIAFAGISLLLLGILTRGSTLFTRTEPTQSPQESKIHKYINAILNHAVSDILSIEADGDQWQSRDFARIRNIQCILSCAVKHSQWVRGLSKGSKRPRLRQRFTCAPPRFSRDYPREMQVSPADAIAELCYSMRGQSIAIIGPSTSYYLHGLWLDALAPHDQYDHKCPGAELCKWHHICLPPGTNNASATGRKFPTSQKLSETGSSLLRFVLSTTLSSKPTALLYHSPPVDPTTGVRSREAFWIDQTRSSQIIILSRPPIPAPAWSHDGTSVGNWSFIAELTSNDTLNTLLNHDPGVSSNKSLQTAQALVIGAALNAITAIFLPSVLDTLRKIQREPDMRSKTLIWHGNWFVHPSCDSHFKGKQIQSNPDDLYKISDPWVLYHDAQVYMQDVLLTTLLPYFNVTYMPLSVPLDTEALGTPSSPSACLLYPSGSSGAIAMSSTFLGGLKHIIQAGSGYNT